MATGAAPQRFVLLRHHAPAAGFLREGQAVGSHWDLLIERPGVEAEHRLASWALSVLPNEWIGLLGLDESTDGENATEATALPDHRAYYLDHEGELSGERGRVEREAAGDAGWIVATERRVAVELSGDLRGVVTLVHLADRRWSLLWSEGGEASQPTP